ncbi:hypothetical protein [Bacillus sp. FJAT-49736]|uniref:hypothetical protein n=1 Tax=Bacillus sp. FJAT-49736 TaxID=2833582 RepID=UPI001BC9318C|nr:hypothetical protein [Bacillus sp. FJAT-49736]MBS4175859.1 hypothetical protein [Bacillus sp. FJAT-49736]
MLFNWGLVVYVEKGIFRETIQNFFYNGFFGSRTYDLNGAEITGTYKNDEKGIVMEVRK